MPAAPTIDNKGFINVVVKINGEVQDAGFLIASVVVSYEINRIPYARVRVLEPGLDQNEYAVVDNDIIKPGNKIEIYAGYGTNAEPIFSGIITGFELDLDSECKAVELECKHQIVRLTVGRKNGMYVQQKDSDIIQDLVKKAGVSAEITPTTVQHAQQVQYYVSDWDFLMLRAEANGYIAQILRDKCFIGKPNLTASASLNLAKENNIIKSTLRINSEDQLSSVKVISFDPTAQDLDDEGPGKISVNQQGNLEESDLTNVMKADNFILMSAGFVGNDDSAGWAEAQMLKSTLSKITGEVSFIGNATVNAGDMIALAGISDRFNGEGFVSGIKHQIEDGSWTTIATFGMENGWFAEKPDIVAPPAGGLTSPVFGMQTGVVKQIHEDPNGQFRVQVTMPLMQEDGEALWVRLGSPYASNNAGHFFYPEIGDEVIVGFMNNDPRYGVIMGSVHSSKKAAPLTPDEKNSQKAIITKSNLKLLMDDENKIITIITPGNNQIVISDKDKSIEITDQHSNSIKMDQGGITMNACQNVKISAKQDIELNATGNIKLQATQNVNVSGLNITESANVKYSAQGQAQAELTASGPLTIKGAIVMIN
ncbi:MAG: type VI secretion system tip protein VgrG [Chitinophagaceae bacterium]